MGEVLRRLTAFAVVASLCAYVVFLSASAVIEAQAAEAMRTIMIRDTIAPNTHRMSGMVTLPSTCTELTIRPEQVSDVAFHLHFDTWEHPHLQCLREPTARAFHTVVFAPAVGVEFFATLDGRPLPIVVTPIIP